RDPPILASSARKLTAWVFRALSANLCHPERALDHVRGGGETSVTGGHNGASPVGGTVIHRLHRTGRASEAVVLASTERASSEKKAMSDGPPSLRRRAQLHLSARREVRLL